MKSPYIVRRTVENSYLVRQRDQRRRRELLRVAAAVVLLGGGLLSYTAIQVGILAAGYRADELARQLHRLEQDERYQRLAISRLTSPKELEERARQELGMEYPTLAQTVFSEAVFAKTRSAKSRSAETVFSEERR